METAEANEVIYNVYVLKYKAYEGMQREQTD